MKTVVVGGHTRNIGKTSVMAALIRGLKSCNWTAVKITQYGHGICSLDGVPCGCAPREHPFVLSEEKDATAATDTSRFLAAGARRSLWLRVRQGQLVQALPLLQRALADEDYAMIESNSILNFVAPTVFVVVLDSLKDDFKPSAREFLMRADALVRVESGAASGANPWASVDPRALEGKPAFPVRASEYFSAELCQFVRQKLQSAQQQPERNSWVTLAPEIHSPETESRLQHQKEQPCQH